MFYINFIYSIGALYFFYEALQCYDYMEMCKNKSIYLKNTYKQTLMVIEQLRRLPPPPNFEDSFKISYVQRTGRIFFYFQKIEYENFQENMTYYPRNINFLTEEYVILLRIIDYINHYSAITDLNMVKMKEKINDHFTFHKRYLQDYQTEKPCFYIDFMGVWNILLHIIISVSCTIIILI
jgi:hypothetical protein